MKSRNQDRKTTKSTGKGQGPYSAAQDKAVRKDATASRGRNNYDEPSRESQTKSRSGNRVGGSNH